MQSAKRYASCFPSLGPKSNRPAAIPRLRFSVFPVRPLIPARLRGARLSHTAVCALDDALAGSATNRRADEFDRRLDVPPHKRAFQIALACEFDMPHRLP